MKIKFKKTHEDAILPRKNHSEEGTGDAGFDLFAVESIQIPARGSKVVPIGLQLAYMTPGYWFRIEPRSGLGFKKSLQPHLGVIDNGYRGDLAIKIYNFSDTSQVIEKGQGVAQFVAYRMLKTEVSFTDEVEEASRGDKGLGSSDHV